MLSVKNKLEVVLENQNTVKADGEWTKGRRGERGLGGAGRAFHAAMMLSDCKGWCPTKMLACEVHASCTMCVSNPLETLGFPRYT